MVDVEKTPIVLIGCDKEKLDEMAVHFDKNKF